MSDSALRKVDHTALRVNQATIIILMVAAFVFNQWWLVAAVAVIMLLGTLVGRPGFLLFYSGLLRPLHIARPDILNDNPEPHRFAQGFGGIVAGVSAVLLLVGASAGGWVLTWLVVVLAALNLFVGFCAGCAVYYWLNRLKAPGFTKAPPAGIVPGMRPKA